VPNDDAAYAANANAHDATNEYATDANDATDAYDAANAYDAQ
jgi:hypothetical protein